MSRKRSRRCRFFGVWICFGDSCGGRVIELWWKVISVKSFRVGIYFLGVFRIFEGGSLGVWVVGVGFRGFRRVIGGFRF